MQQKLEPGSQTLSWFLIIQLSASEEKLWFKLWLKRYTFYKWTDLRLIKIILGVSGHFLNYFTDALIFLLIFISDIETLHFFPRLIFYKLQK